MMNKGLCISVFLVFALSACAVPYVKKGSTDFIGGYDDKKIGDNKYVVRFDGNGYTTYEVAEKYFHQRSDELCGGKPYKHTLIRTTTQHRSEYFTGRQYGVTAHVFPVVYGEVECTR
jgi:hypothetical protein